jgi:adenosylcobinamide kinase/adenosylcobinamide-phosphate guanylyltransferase
MDVPGALTRALQGSAVVVVDCVTLWITNLLLADEGFAEDQASVHAQALVDHATAGAVIVVTNEVGCGVVPETALGRRFRDCAGRANQVIARGADEVYLMVSGIPVRIKPTGENS